VFLANTEIEIVEGHGYEVTDKAEIDKENLINNPNPTSDVRPFGLSKVHHHSSGNQSLNRSIVKSISIDIYFSGDFYPSSFVPVALVAAHGGRPSSSKSAHWKNEHLK
jgi:hypothetical protein